MYENQGIDQAAMAQQIAPGATVFDASGEKVGRVAELNPPAGYMLVEKGWLFLKDFYVPTSAIRRVEAGDVYLQLFKDDLQQPQYDNPPVGQTLGTDTSLAGSATVAATPTAGATTVTDDIRVPVREEELIADTRREEQGRVQVHKDVVEEEQTVNVPLRQERVTVERVPLSRDVDPATLDREAFTERDIEVPVMGEEAVVGKRVQGVEEVRLHKEVVTEQEQVSDTVRKERVTVDGVDDQGSTPTDRGRTREIGD